MQQFKKDKLSVKITVSRAELGAIAASTVANKIIELLATKAYVNVVFAAAPSQSEFLASLVKENIPWDRINAFHMDEYIGLSPDAPQGFGNFLYKNLFSKITTHSTNYLNGNATDLETECQRYTDLLKTYPSDIVCMGIGENTHIAFNDPHVADFKDPAVVKIVDLDIACRQQQINDGCFKELTNVPTHALTLTISALYNANYIYCMVPGPNKANAVKHTLNEDISELYPSTILRAHANAVLFIDKESSAFLLV